MHSMPGRRAGRPENVAAKEQHQLMLLKAVADLPWAEARLLQAYTRLAAHQLRAAAHELVQSNQLDLAEIPTRARRAPQRYGLAPPGAARLGQRFAAPFWRRTLLAALCYDPARLVLFNLLHSVEVVWALSPFTLAAEAVRAEGRPRLGGRPVPSGMRPYRSVPMDLLACLQLDIGQYLNVLVIVDPGGVSLEPLQESLRSLSAWRRRGEFRGRTRTLPLTVSVAANEERAQAFIQYWRQSAPGAPGALRVMTWQALAQSNRRRQPFADWRWWNERHQVTAFWPGLTFSPSPSRRPNLAVTAWWAEPAGDLQEANPDWPPPFELKRRAQVSGVIAQARLNKKKEPPHTDSRALGLAAVDWHQAICDHLNTTAMGRRLLDRIGVFPLLTATDLALVVGLDAANVRREIALLRKAGLVDAAHPAQDEGGYGLTWRGLTLLAVQAGHLPKPYAELRHWPVTEDEHGPRYSLEAALRVREHTDIVIEFLVGLRKAAERERLALQRWEHMQTFEESLAHGTRAVRVMPDAEGCIRSFGPAPEHYVDTPFWLEVDRGTLNGRALQEKLRRYYRLRSDTPGVRGRRERLLIVVERDAEGRLRTLCRRLRTLDEAYHTRLDVRLTRLDLLDNGHGRLNPARRVWRTPYASTFRGAFRRWGKSDDE
jgi:hypothetical protein